MPAQPSALHKIDPADARPGDRFVFVADEGGERFVGTILMLAATDMTTLAQVRWDDERESWTPLTVTRGIVEVWRGEQDGTEVAIETSGADHQEPQEAVRERRAGESVAGAETADRS
jgi:hypothetical protein